MQLARDRRADAPRAARDQHCLAGEAAVLLHDALMTSAASVTTCRTLTPTNPRIAARVSRTSAQFIAASAVASGFDAYMRLALYAPGLGLLQRRRAQARRGRGFHHRAGDVAACSRVVWRVSAPTGAAASRGGDILELGAGSGPHGRRRAHGARRVGCVARRVIASSKSAPTCASGSARACEPAAASSRRACNG